MVEGAHGRYITYLGPVRDFQRAFRCCATEIEEVYFSLRFNFFRNLSEGWAALAIYLDQKTSKKSNKEYLTK